MICVSIYKIVYIRKRTYDFHGIHSELHKYYTSIYKKMYIDLPHLLFTVLKLNLHERSDAHRRAIGC